MKSEKERSKELFDRYYPVALKMIHEEGFKDVFGHTLEDWARLDIESTPNNDWIFNHLKIPKEKIPSGETLLAYKIMSELMHKDGVLDEFEKIAKHIDFDGTSDYDVMMKSFIWTSVGMISC